MKIDDYILKYRSKPIASNARSENQINGNDAEIFAASQLLSSIGAEIRWGTRNEDSRKIDIIGSLEHPWIAKERLLILIQVKSGSYYGEEVSNGFRLKSTAKQAAIRTIHPILLIWISRNANKAFWAYIHSNSSLANEYYDSSHKLNPASKFDIAGIQSKFLNIKKGGKGIIISTQEDSLTKRRTSALEAYRKYKHEKLFSPSFGEIEFTRKGWKRMFRKSRSSKNKNSSLLAIPYLKQILKDLPSKVYKTKIINDQFNGFEHRLVEYVLTFNETKLFDETDLRVKSIRFICRLIEEVRYPKDWREESQISQLTERRVSLTSCYYKLQEG